MATPEFVTEIKHHWPADRLTNGFESYWATRFGDWPSSRVADAVRALKIERDPYAPTCEAVERILRDWGIAPIAESVEVAMTRDQQENRRVLGKQLDAQQQADDALCVGIGEEDFTTYAHAALRAAHSQELEIVPGILAIYARRKLRDWPSVRALVAAHCRQHGLVSSNVLRIA